MMANWFDQAVRALAPKTYARREYARAQGDSIKQIRAMYDGAARGNRVGFRAIGGSSANTEIMRSRHRLVDVSRDLERNNPIAASCREAWTTNVVGAGIIPAVTSSNARTKTLVQDLIRDHLDTTAIDFDGRSTLYALQAMAVSATVRDGEVLIVRYMPPSNLRLPVPLQIRILEIDYLDMTKNGPVDGGNVCFEGIEFDKNGRRAAYWLFDEHPGGGVTWRYPVSHRVPAADVIHHFRTDRPGQVRGVPWCAPAIVTMWDLHDYEDAELMRQKIAACFAVFITGDAPRSLADQVSKTETTATGVDLETVSPGMVKRLPSNVDVKFATPPMVTGFKDFQQVYNRKICIGYGVPYEIGTGDLSNVTFISGRLGLMQFNRGVDQVRWHVVIPHACATIGRWFMEAAAVAAGRALAARLDWTPPRREMVSPKDEVPAIKSAIRAGLTTRSEENRKAGYDPEQIEQEIADENKRADALGLRFDSDGRYPETTRGSEQITPPADGGDGTGDNGQGAGDNGNNPPAKPAADKPAASAGRRRRAR